MGDFKMANEVRLIDANEMKNNITEAMMRQFEKNGDQIALRIAEMMWHFIDKTDTVDAVEVVRCKDCKHGVIDAGTNRLMCARCGEIRPNGHVWGGTSMLPENFCSYGERGTDNA